MPSVPTGRDSDSDTENTPRRVTPVGGDTKNSIGSTTDISEKVERYSRNERNNRNGRVGL